MYKRFQLKNGMRAVVVPREDTAAVTVLILYKVGSRYETKSLNGVSHFLEHLMFKGTKKRPNTLAISKELDSVGAEFNAFTGKDHTGYYIKVAAPKIGLALDMLSDMLYRSKFDAKELDRERGVIKEEIRMYEDNPLMYIGDIFESAMFSGSTLGWNIAGSEKTVDTMQREKMLAYKNHFYQPHNAVLAIGGKITDDIEKQVEQYFGNKNTIQKKLRTYKPFTVDQKNPRVKCLYRDTNQTQVMLGWPAFGYTSSQLPALQLLSTIMGGNMSSRLFIRVRERKGLCYLIRAGMTVYEDRGNFEVHAGLDSKRIIPALELILKELYQVREKGVTAAELKKAKQYYAGKMILALEDSSALAEWFAKQALLTKKVLTPEQKMKQLEKVTLADIQEVAKKVMIPARLTLAMIGPYKNTKPFKKLIAVAK